MKMCASASVLQKPLPALAVHVLSFTPIPVLSPQKKSLPQTLVQRATTGWRGKTFLEVTWSLYTLLTGMLALRCVGTQSVAEP